MATAPDYWPELRAALAHTTQQHYRNLRLIAANADPRLVAAEQVATAATAILQSPELWYSVSAAAAHAAGDMRRRRTLLGCLTDEVGLSRLERRISTLDWTCREWTEQAYPQPKLPQALEHG